MKLKKLRVAGWRCFARPIELTDFGPGLNIVHGPNGVGKSSLFGTLVRVFGDRFKSKAEAVRLLQPWGTDLSPHASLEFEHRGERWQLEKQFLTGAFTRLQKWDGRHWQPISENESADERLREMFQMEAPGKKNYEPTQWGIAQVLWASQGDLQLGALSDAARNLVQASLGVQVIGVEGSEVENRVEKDYLSIFTPTGNLRGGNQPPPLVVAQQKLSEVQQRLQLRRSQLQTYEDAVRRIEDRRLLADQAQREEQRVAREATEALEQAQRYAQLLHERDLASQEVDRTRAQAEQIRQRIDAIVHCRLEITRGEEKQQQLKILSSSLQQDSTLRSKLAEEASQHLNKTRQRREVVEKAKQRVQRAERMIQAQRQKDRGDNALAQLHEYNREREILKAEFVQLQAPSPAELRALRDAFRKHDEARTRLESALITLEITPENEISVSLLQGEPAAADSSIAASHKAPDHDASNHEASEKRIKLPPHATWIGRGSPEVVVHVAGLGMIRARGPSESADELRERFFAAEQKLAQCLQPWGNSDLASLETSSLRAGELSSKLEALQARCETLLGKQSEEELQREVLMAGRLVEEALVAEAEWRTVPPDLSRLHGEAETLQREFVAAIDHAESQRDITNEEWNQARLRETQNATELSQTQAQIANLQAQLTQWINDGLTDEARQRAFSDASLAFTSATARLHASQEKLTADGADPRESARLLQEQVAGLRKIASEAVSNLHHAEGELRQLVSQSPYTALASEEEEQARLQDEIQLLQLEADALKLLRQTILQERKNLVDTLVGPVRKRVQRTMQRVIGSRFGDLEMDRDFSASSVQPRDQELAVGLEQLSGGEREQVHFSVRLAIAELAFPDGNQLVVLDDVFTSTDRLRLARITQLLDELAEKFQVVLLTCHPERYAGMKNAKLFDLESLMLAPAPTESFTGQARLPNM